jgi:hypothetical protein
MFLLPRKPPTADAADAADAGGDTSNDKSAFTTPPSSQAEVVSDDAGQGGGNTTDVSPVSAIRTPLAAAVAAATPTKPTDADRGRLSVHGQAGLPSPSSASVPKKRRTVAPVRPLATVASTSHTASLAASLAARRLPAAKPNSGAGDQSNKNKHVWQTAWGGEHGIKMRVGFELAQFIRGRNKESTADALQKYAETGVLPVELKAVATKEEIDEKYFHLQLRATVSRIGAAGK